MRIKPYLFRRCMITHALLWLINTTNRATERMMLNSHFFHTAADDKLTFLQTKVGCFLCGKE